MQIAIISDVHGNCFAFDAVLDDIRRQGIERIVCLGDMLQGGAQPAEMLARLRKLNCPVVMGNADARLLAGQAIPGSEQQLAVRAWTLAQLSVDDQEFISQFRPTIEIVLEAGKKLLCFHGSPRSFDDVILPSTPDETVRQFLSGFDATLLTGGHTHTQQLRRLDDSWYFNPGSVSLSYSRNPQGLPTSQIQVDPWADYAIVSSDGANFGVTFRHVPFDVEALAQIIRASGRPYAEEIIALYRRLN